MAPENKDGDKPGTDSPPPVPGEPTQESGPPASLATDPEVAVAEPEAPAAEAAVLLKKKGVPEPPAPPSPPRTLEIDPNESALEEGDEDALHSVGMFITDDSDKVDIDSLELPPELAEPSFAQLRRNMISWVIFVLVLIAFGVGGSKINGDKDLRIQIEYLFKGGLERHKMAHIIELREKYAKQDHYAQNRYGEFKMMYSPRTARVSVTQIKYRESIDEFMKRFVRGAEDKRVKVEERELKKFRDLTTNLKKNVVVAESVVKNLPISSRSNPKDKKDSTRIKACTDNPEDYCTFVYRVKISKKMYYPRTFLIFSEYSLDPPKGSLDLDDPEQAKEWAKAQTLHFKQVGPNIFEVVWPGADLRPTPELFREQYIRVMTDRLKCKLGPEDYEPLKLKAFKDLMELPEDERWQLLSGEGWLSHGPPNSKVWTQMEWKASIAELKDNPELWTEAESRIAECSCEEDKEGRRIKCWQGEDAGTTPAPTTPTPSPTP